MSIRVAINGYGRIGRNVLRALYENKRNKDIEIVAINDLADATTLAHLTRYDTTHGRFQFPIALQNNTMEIAQQKILLLSERDPAQLPWKKLNIDIVLECSGKFATRDKAEVHLKAGAKKVIISAPAGKEVDATIVYGINHDQLSSKHQIISNASCTTNCLAPMVKLLHDNFGLQHGLMTTVHSYTNDQALIDIPHHDLHRARAAAHSMIPTTTGATKALDLVLPELTGRITGYSIRVPTINVSALDFTCTVEKSVSIEAVNQVFKQAAQKQLKDILVYSEEPLVSVDYNHHPASCIIDGTQTLVRSNLVKVFGWYDNEWGYSNRLLDVILVWMKTN